MEENVTALLPPPQGRWSCQTSDRGTAGCRTLLGAFFAVLRRM
jgi:hypothetical protein